MAHIQTNYLKLWKPQDLVVDKISSQKMFIDNIDALDSFALSILGRVDAPVASIEELRAIDTSDIMVYHDCITIMVKSHGVYFFDRLNTSNDDGKTIIAPTVGGGRWISQHSFLGAVALKDTLTASDVGLGNVPNVSTNNQAPTFTQASTLANIASGEKLNVIMGKIMKAIADLISHIANKSNPHSVTATQLGLGNVDNTSDANKPVSTAQATAIATAKSAGDTAQVNLNTHIANKTNPHGVTAAQLGLGNVPNVSTNDQTPTFTEAATLTTLTSGEKLSISMGKVMKAITDLISHLANKTNPHSVTATQLGLGNVDNTSDANKPVSTAQATAIGNVQTNLNTHTNNKTNPHGVTATQVGLGNVPNVSTNDQTPTYTTATTLTALTSGEKLSVSMGKITKAIVDLISHLANKTNPHSVTTTQIGAIPTVSSATANNIPILASGGTITDSTLGIDEIDALRHRGTITYVPSGTNLDNYTTVGKYVVLEDSIAATLVNRPSNYRGLLTVKSLLTTDKTISASASMSNALFLQEYIDGLGITYTRRMFVTYDDYDQRYGLGVGAWQRLTSTGTVATASVE